MIFEFLINKDIHRKHSNIIDNNLEYCKCRFYIDTTLWYDVDLFATFTNDYNDIETIPLGQAKELLTCLIPQKFLIYNKVFLYIHSNDFKTNTIVIDLHKIPKIKREKNCNVIIDIFKQIDTKIDNIIYEDNQLKCYSNGRLIDMICLQDLDEESLLYLKEDITNKTITISEQSTDDEYPSAKAVYEYINNMIEELKNDT